MSFLALIVLVLYILLLLKNMDIFKKSLLHALEFFLVLAAAFTFVYVFHLGETDTAAVVATVLAFFVKYVRTSPSIPVDDYVNK